LETGGGMDTFISKILQLYINTIIMKYLFFLLMTGLSLVATAQIKPAAKGVVYGAKSTSAEGAIDVAAMQEKMISETGNFTGKIKGTVLSVCEKKGCWMTIAKPGGEEIMVRFKDYGFFMPKNIVGKEVVLDGEAKLSVTDVETLRHYAEDAGKGKEEIEKITLPKSEIEFTAKGVVVL